MKSIAEEMLEVRRKIFHIIFGSVIVTLLYFNVFSAWHLFFLLLIGIALALISLKWKIPGISWFLMKFERKASSFPGKGPIFFMVGALLAVQLFPRDIALASIMILTLGDAVSLLYGKFFGKLKNIYSVTGKYYEGMLLGMFTAFLGAWLFVSPLLAFFGAAIGMLAEVLEFQLNKMHVDDNILVPLVAGTAMYLVRFYL